MTPLNKPVTRKTGTRASTYGADAKRLIAVTLIPGGQSDDLIELRPLRTKRPRCITVRDLWSYLERCAADKAWSDRMLKKKVAKADQRAKRSAARVTAKLRRDVARESCKGFPGA